MKHSKDINRHKRNIKYYVSNYKDSNFKLVSYNKAFNLSIWRAQELVSESDYEVIGRTFWSRENTYVGPTDYGILILDMVSPEFEKTLLHEFIHFVNMYLGIKYTFKSQETEELFAHAFGNMSDDLIKIIKKGNK